MYKHKKLLFEGFVQNQLPGIIFETINCHKWTGNVLESPCACIISIVLEGSGQPALNVINAAAASSTCIRMISQRYKSGTISTPEGGAVVNGALYRF